jgi:hypothetical protein
MKHLNATIYLTVDGERKTFIDLERETGVNRKTLHSRWTAMGKPLTLGYNEKERLFRAASFKGNSPFELKITVMPGERKMTISQILELPTCKINRSSILARAKGGNGVINEADLVPVKKSDPQWGTLGTSYVRKVDDLPHIVAGDLCHLSDNGDNTGQGRGEIPHEEWVQFYGRKKAISGGRIAF